ncbi:hypothetical protein [Deinococcus radiophilus]|uniref:Uncharacterized protein n=1 Tax=Deinococcus radiophilus TaxID=32062 RepID=A0A3S0IJA9_9DEIO|nr:hypothetical protein [Deinococcus radiophilus]RTR25300.1 hypothetical protein EJ104_11385 [Deinococcus radiophilus]UFA52051.1 hypothetical protein LMT64_14090 [Deinococcus radiophilus]
MTAITPTLATPAPTAPVFVGREPEGRAVIVSVRAGRSVQLEAPSGYGKSALLAELAPGLQTLAVTLRVPRAVRKVPGRPRGRAAGRHGLHRRDLPRAARRCPQSWDVPSLAAVRPGGTPTAGQSRSPRLGSAEDKYRSTCRVASHNAHGVQ